MKILGIETSCDETAVSVVDGSGVLEAPEFKVLSSVVSSQMKLHAEWGGVVPMLAKREHQKNLVPVLEQCLRESSLFKERSAPLPPTTYNLQPLLIREPNLIAPLTKLLQTIEAPDIAAIGVTKGPGLEPALWVGINFAQALANAWQKPLYAINHMEGHILAALLGGKEEGGSSESQASRSLASNSDPEARLPKGPNLVIGQSEMKCENGRVKV